MALACALFAPDAAGQQAAPTASPTERTQATQMDADGTRRALMELLNRHPPSVGRVLRLDPSLMTNEAYLATYPQLRQFFGAHPEVSQNAPYYLEQVRGAYPDHWQPRTYQQEMVEGVLAGIAVVIGSVVAICTLFWLIRTMLDQRRWNRLSKIQAEVHTKLMDRFSTNEELLSYVQTPSGRRFLESGPSPLQEASPSVAAPYARILWSVQIGAVLTVGGIGMLFISNGSEQPELKEFFYVLGCLTTTLGGGFVVSAIAAYFLSWRFGLFEPRPVDHA
jgi:hypothetical protein